MSELGNAAKRGFGREIFLVVLAIAATAPWLVLRFLGYHGDPAIIAALSGIAILGAGFMLSWAAEAFQMDVSQAFALALLALIAVLPEYAVDGVFAWNAGSCVREARMAADVATALVGCEAESHYAIANMTGANRLLIGIGWSAIIFVAWLRFRVRAVRMEQSQAIELCVLLVATIYSFVIPIKGSLEIIDCIIMGTLFVLYAWATAKAPSHEPELVGPARMIGELPVSRRRLVTYSLFVFAALVIFVSAEPFAEGLVTTGKTFGIDEFLLVQWLAPLASESPEFLVALLFTWRGDASAGLRVIVSSTVNQWTLLVGTLPVVYSVALGQPGSLTFDTRQDYEVFITSAQSLLGIVLVAGLSLNRTSAIVLFVLFVLQLFAPWDTARLSMAIVYVVLALLLLLFDRGRRASMLRLPGLARKSLSEMDPASVGH